MAVDRFVYWGEEKPTWAQVRKVVEDYFNRRFRVSGDEQRIVVTPLLEVFVDEDSVDVITRQADDFTDAVANGLAVVFQRRWGKPGS